MPGFTPAAAVPQDVKVAASDTLLKESTGEETETGQTYAKIKSIGTPSNRVRSTVRVTFTLKGGSGADAAFGKIYIDGVATGTEQQRVAATYATYTEDFSITDLGTEIELWLKCDNASHPALTDNLSIKGDETEIDQDWEVIT